MIILFNIASRGGGNECHPWLDVSCSIQNRLFYPVLLSGHHKLCIFTFLRNRQLFNLQRLSPSKIYFQSPKVISLENCFQSPKVISIEIFSNLQRLSPLKIYFNPSLYNQGCVSHYTNLWIYVLIDKVAYIVFCNTLFYSNLKFLESTARLLRIIAEI